MSEKQKRGALIAVEGLDRSGKSTQTAILMDRLKQSGVDAKLLKFPGKCFFRIVLVGVGASELTCYSRSYDTHR